MNDAELKQLWQQQPLRTPDVSPAQLISAMHRQTTWLRHVLDARDLRELAACAVILVIFGFYAYGERTPISRAGDLIVVGSTIFVAWKLVHTRRRTPPAPPGATVVESLRAELDAVRAQSRLLGSVLWWYLLPGLIGLLVGTWGMDIHLHAKISATLAFIALDAFVYWLNRRARAKQLLPLEAQLESLIRSAETGGPPDETRVANLRPVVLSMAAADHVKPVEFKVAFSQIAIYGISGFVGIWFFLMLYLTVNANDGQVRERAVEPPAPAVAAPAPGVSAGETNRYSVVARKVVDRFNAGDYTAVHGLYNPEMRQVFPLKETTDFYTRLAAFGKVEKLEGPTGNGFRGWTAFRLHCQYGELVMSLALDEEDKISGIHFRPVLMSFAADRSFVLGKLFVLRLFSGQHLLWLVPFLLGGWLYSRLLQKTTERAVGISALGIHLHTGLKLILWDEVKEVRPFRLLNIRSLWLIHGPGEKTIMPWSSLERPSDLKAAVERFAPPDHPIRKYLSLLRRS